MNMGDGLSTKDAAAIRAEIARTREQLSDTVEALAAKVDVRARLDERMDEVRHELRGRAADAAGKVRQRVGPAPAGIALAVLALAATAVSVLLARRSHADRGKRGWGRR